MQFKPKKSLGQNFLVDKNIINLIVDLGQINENDIIIEVGPGTGNLTNKIISKNPKKIILIEKDFYLANELKKKYGNKIELINEDILKIDDNNFHHEKMIVFGNLPYNISTQILVKWIKIKNLEKKFKCLILMFQKEVADRIIANTNSKNYGRLSIFSKWKMEIKKIKEINPDSFNPSPKVKSTILIFKPKKNFFELKNSENLEKITNIFFNQRRKMIKNPINKIFNNSKEIEKKLNLDLKMRPQNLEPSIYYKLCNEYEKLIK
tara:strand:- start:244 stop:1035 length:792 start_codon:yes stop_codon:yes gene_type:complete